MRYIVISVLFLSFLLHAENYRIAIIAGSTDPNSLKLERQTLNDYIRSKAEVGKFFETEHLKIDTYSKHGFHFLYIYPLSSVQAKNELQLFLHDLYPDIFFVNENFSREPNTDTQQKRRAKRREKSASIATVSQNAIDMLWLAILALSVVGLTASVLQRKNILRFAKKQKELKENQSTINKELDKMGGEENV